jgi:hypothetical protein
MFTGSGGDCMCSMTLKKSNNILVWILSIKFFIEREPHSQPEISQRGIEGENGRRGESGGRKAVVTCFQGLGPFPLPPPHALPGANSAQSVPLTPPSTLLSPACDVILMFSAPFGGSPQWPRPRGPKMACLKEEAKLTNFLFYGFTPVF